MAHLLIRLLQIKLETHHLMSHNIKLFAKQILPVSVQSLARIVYANSKRLRTDLKKSLEASTINFRKKPSKWVINWESSPLIAQEYAGRVVLYAEGNSLMSNLRIASDIYEPEELFTLEREIKERNAKRVLDIGANIGLISLALLQKFPSLQIDAFEPGSHQYSILNATIKYNHLESQVKLHQLALGNYDGTADFFAHDEKDSSGDGLVDTGRAKFVRKFQVDIRKLDTWWDQLGKPPVDVIKVDTEGAELFVLEGATELLNTNKPIVLLEIWPGNLDNYPYKAQDILSWLNNHNYDLETLNGQLILPSFSDKYWGKEFSFIARPQPLGVIPKKLIVPYLPENPIIVEAGAHVGSDTLDLSKLWPKGHIHAFEPIPSIFQKLSRNTQSQKNVTCYQIALSNTTETASMYVSSGSSDASSSLLQPHEHLSDHPTVQFNSMANVQTITLDDWAKVHNIDKVDCLWLDMQGHEFNVLKASPNILQTVRAIVTEANLKETYKGVLLYHEFQNWLEGQGFTIVREALAWDDGGDVFFVRR